MQPDVKRERRAGWLALGAALVLSGTMLGWYASDDSIAEQLKAARSERDRLSGPELMSEHVAKQEGANVKLRDNIEDLKKGTGFTVTRDFTILPEDKKPGEHEGSIFKERFLKVRQDFMDLGHDRNIRYDIDLGFSKEVVVPRDEDAAFLLTMLQLTRKATQIAFHTPTPIKSFAITHGRALPTGPTGRPPLREYPLTMEITGSLRDVLWILHRLSSTDKDAASAEDPGGYPLVVQGLQIDSSVTSEITDPNQIIQQVKATFRIAGMQFIPEDQRGARVAVAAPVRSATRLVSTPAAPSRATGGARP